MEDIKFEKIPSGIYDKVKNNREEFVEKFIDELEELFPDTVKDGKVDFEALLERFGEYQDHDERYELTWVGKNKARQESFEDLVGKTLKYIEEDSKNPDTTENLYIEGDNLEVLKLLRNSYYGKIKMIYIDPPYNRKKGDDLIYRDDFTLSKEDYDELKGDLDDYGKRLVKNSPDSGRYHSDWLNMIYPRLQVAKDLLTDDGAIFISIDGNEQENLKKICDEVFGEKNYIGEIIRKTKSMVGDDGVGLNVQHEYLIIYSKNKTNIKLIGEEKDFKNYSNPDNDKNGDWCTADPSAKSGGDTTYFEIVNPYTNKIDLPPKGRYWAFNKDTMEHYIEKGRIVFKKTHKDTERGFIFKRYKRNLDSIYNPLSTIFGVDNLYMNQNGKKDLEEINMGNIFSYPKPIKYISNIINSINDKNVIVLDFFSGSATTAHAVMDLNAGDGGNRKFIMVQLPEPTDEKSAAYKEGYENICEIGKERIRRAGEKIREDNKDKKGIEDLDTGFKVFRVEDTNFRRIREAEGQDLESKYKSLSKKDREDFNSHFTDLDVVYELMLRRQDIEITEEIRQLEDIGDRTYIVGDTMLACLEEDISEEMVEKIGDIDTDLSWIVLRDSAFDDKCDLKINTAKKLRSIIKSSRRKNQKIYWI